MITSGGAAVMEGRLAVVTGSNKGVGYFIALQLGMSGLFEHVLLGCRDATRAEEAVSKMKAALPTVQYSWAPLELGNTSSHKDFASHLEKSFGKVDCLVNNAAMAFKGADPTPFEKQTKPTLDVNFRGTVDLTETLLPLLEKGTDVRVINVASMAGHLSQLSPDLQAKFSSNSLTMTELHGLVQEFESAVQDGTYSQKGWSSSNYGLSKLAVIAATKIWARELASKGITVNACCPGYCKTDMTSQRGTRDPAEGAKNAVIPATMSNPPTGEMFKNFKVSEW